MVRQNLLQRVLSERREQEKEELARQPSECRVSRDEMSYSRIAVDGTFAIFVLGGHVAPFDEIVQVDALKDGRLEYDNVRM